MFYDMLIYTHKEQRKQTKQKEKENKQMIKIMIWELNRAMIEGEISFTCVENLLKELSVLTGKEYEIINKRVVYRENNKLHDAWVNA